MPIGAAVFQLSFNLFQTYIILSALIISGPFIVMLSALIISGPFIVMLSVLLVSGPFIVMLTHMIKDLLRFTFLYLEFYIPFGKLK